LSRPVGIVWSTEVEKNQDVDGPWRATYVDQYVVYKVTWSEL